ncbi:hypothetical protein F5880DRAFT_1672711 [Lentinula raphanica]|nr:hypothetical protein F5880DRAFT_1672711 [Lentinula raphanica]
MPAQRTSRRKTNRSSDNSVSASDPSSSRKRSKNPHMRTSLETAPTAAGCGESGSGNPTASQLLSHSHQTTEDWYKSSNTKKGYAGYVKSGKKWILEWASANNEVDSEDSGQSAADTEGLAHGFDSISKYTPMALRLLTAYKCDHQGNKFSTAEGIRSAFKDYFERVLGCQGEFWKFNTHSHEWEGNPVFETDYRTYYESLKNRENRTSTFTQALPMLPADLKILFTYLDSFDGCKEFTLTQRLYFKAFASAAFNLWTRNDELIHFMVKDLNVDLVSETGVPYIEFHLIFRKTNKDPNKVQVYHIPIDSNHSELDCYTHMTAWVTHLQTLLQRPLMNTDYVFPGIASTGQLKFGENTSRMGIENLLESIVEASGLMKGRSGKFTTHCFRRGGAQYRFMWADHKWSLKAVKWWGGWSSNENVGTIMRYLLDELMAYEEGFTDIMMPDSSPARHESFMGSSNNKAEPISRQDILSLEHKMMKKFDDMAKSWPITPPATPHGHRMLHSEAHTRSSTNIIESSSPATQGPSSNGPQLTPLHQTPPSPSQTAPHPSRIPEVNSLDDVIRYWEEGDVRRGLVTPLKEWKRLFNSKEYKSEAVKLSNIRFVYEEFSSQHSGSYDSFEASFPDLRFQYTKLLHAVRRARKARGEAKSRRR